MKKAVIKEGVVENIIVANDDFQLEGYDLVTLTEDDVVDIGYVVEIADGEYVFKENITKPESSLDDYLLDLDFRVSLIELGL